MKRRKPLRRTELPRPTIDQVRAWERRPRLPLTRRKPLAKKSGSKAIRESFDLAEFRRALRARDTCEATGMRDRKTRRLVCSPYVHRGQHPHHVWPEDRDRGLHDPARGLWLCFDAHRWTHDHPAPAARLGLLRPKEKR